MVGNGSRDGSAPPSTTLSSHPPSSSTHPPTHPPTHPSHLLPTRTPAHLPPQPPRPSLRWRAWWTTACSWTWWMCASLPAPPASRCAVPCAVGWAKLGCGLGWACFCLFFFVFSRSLGTGLLPWLHCNSRVSPRLHCAAALPAYGVAACRDAALLTAPCPVLPCAPHWHLPFRSRSALPRSELPACLLPEESGAQPPPAGLTPRRRRQLQPARPLHACMPATRLPPLSQPPLRLAALFLNPICCPLSFAGPL